jgi:hypothetical protein
VLPALKSLNVMHLANPHPAILSAVIYNAIIKSRSPCAAPSSGGHCHPPSEMLI